MTGGREGVEVPVTGGREEGREGDRRKGGGVTGGREGGDRRKGGGVTGGREEGRGGKDGGGAGVLSSGVKTSFLFVLSRTKRSDNALHMCRFILEDGLGSI